MTGQPTKGPVLNALGKGAALASVACGLCVAWYLLWYPHRQHRTSLADWETIPLYDGAVTLEMPEDQTAFQLHPYALDWFLDSNWMIDVTPFVTIPGGYRCWCFLPEEQLLSLPKERRGEWYRWVADTHESASTFELQPTLTDYQRDYAMPLGYEFTLHVRYFKARFSPAQVAEDEGAIARILDSVKVVGPPFSATRERCAELAREGMEDQERREQEYRQWEPERKPERPTP